MAPKIETLLKSGSKWMLVLTVMAFIATGILTMLGKDWYGYLSSVPVTKQLVEQNRKSLDAIGTDVKTLLWLHHEDHALLHEHTIILEYHGGTITDCKEILKEIRKP